MPNTPLFPSVGTNSTPYYLPLTNSPDVTRTDQGYFSVQVYGAQAAFTGGFWDRAKRFMVSSQVNLHLDDKHELGGQSLEGILAYRDLKKNEATQLGFSPILIDFVPATMKRVSVSIKYVVDKENNLAKLAGVIDSKELLAMVSLAPGAALAAQTISKLTGKLIDTFMPQDERKAILQFSGDFELADAGVKEGYYIILGSHDSGNPLPATPPTFEVRDGGQLIADGKPVTQLSYVILKVVCVDAVRDRFTGKSPWRNKLTEARRVAKDYAEDIFAKSDKKTRQALWETRCLPLLRDAYALLQADPNFLNSETDLIYRNAYQECIGLINDKSKLRGAATQTVEPFEPDVKADRAYLGIGEDEDLVTQLDAYAEQLFKSRKKFKDLGLT